MVLRREESLRRKNETGTLRGGRHHARTKSSVA
jgi:hypothetical protein